MTWKPIKYLAHNNFDPTTWSDENTVKDFGESLTIQSMTEESDLNVIMKRYLKTGQMPEDARPVFYADFENIYDFKTAQDAIIAARHAFEALPTDLRNRFSNDPQQFLEFCSDDRNREEMNKLGLLKASPKAPGEAITPPPATQVATPPKEGS